MDKAYIPKNHENKVLEKWENQKVFFAQRKAESATRQNFTVPIPPPNVTGQLHLGHAMMLVIQDIMTRYHRMKGDATLWLPGTDHAAIATESVVLKNLGIPNREILTREEFMEKCFEHTEKTHKTITNQVKKMGAGCDFSRERYTMDLGLSNAVWKIFKDLYDHGLIVRGHRMVNWSTGAQSVLADDELEYEDQLDSFAYIKCGKFVMGTVRSETKCADSPLVLHPHEKYVQAKFISSDGNVEEFVFSEVLFDDTERRSKIFNQLDADGAWEKVSVHQGAYFEGEEFEYETYAGKRKFFVLCDEEVIDIKKGTGAMTISVCHSADDYLLAKKYPEKLKNYYFEKIGFDGKMTALAGELEGDEVKKARKRAVKIMLEKNLIVGLERDYMHNVPLCYRTGCVVEPMISPQWFIDVNKEFDWQENVGAIKSEEVRSKKYNPVFVFGKSETEGGNIALPYFVDKNEEIDYAQKSDELGCKFTVFVENSNNADYRFRFFYPKGIESKLCGHALLGAAYKCEKQNFTVETTAGIYPVKKENEKVFVQLLKTEKIELNFSGIFPANLLGLDQKSIEEKGILSSGKEKFYIQIDSFENLQNLKYDFEGLKNWNEGKNFHGYIFYTEENGKIYARASNPLENINEDAACLTGISSLSYFYHQPFSVEMGEGGRFNNILFVDPQEDGVWVGGNVFEKSVNSENNFIFVRHGESEDNAKGVLQADCTPLTQNGIEHAQKSAEFLQKSKNITKIISSPSTRALQTAEIIAEKLGLEIEIFDELRCYQTNNCAGISKNKVLPLTPLEYCETHGGEMSDDFEDRTKHVVEKFKRFPDMEGDVVVITHRSNIGYIEAILDGLTKEEAIENRRKKENSGYGILAERKISNSTLIVKNKLFYARHGESEANKSNIFQGILDSPLSEKGIEDAKKLAESVKGLEIKTLVSSNLERANHTARIVKEELGLKIDIQIIPELREINWGDLTGKSQDLKGDKRALEYYLDEQAGETIEELYDQARRAKQKLIEVQEKSSENILVVGHGQIGSIIHIENEGIEPENYIEFYKTQYTHLKNGEVRKLDLQNGAQNSKFKTYLENITSLVSLEKGENKKYSNQKKWIIGAITDEVKEILEIENNEISLSEFVYAKIKGWIHDKPGHRDREDVDFYLLPIILQNIRYVYENTNMPYRSILCNHKGKSYVVVIDISDPQNPLLVTFFYTKRTALYDNNSHYKKRHLEGLAVVPSCITSSLRGEMKRLVARFSSRKMPNYSDIIKLFEKCQHPSYFLPYPNPLPEGEGIIKTSLKKLTYDAVLGENPGVKLIPSRFEKIYHQWIDNLQDWCISRQIWWGHQIPIWYDKEGNEHVAQEQTLLFARHGESEDNADGRIGGDSPLTEKGRKQAERLAQKLISEGRNISKIYYSSLKRSKETADIIASQLNIKTPHSNLLSEEKAILIEEIPDFHEVYAGDLENTKRIVKEQYPHTLHKMIDMKTGESMKDLEMRAKKFWDIVSEKGAEDGDILFIGHRTFLSQVFGVKDGCTADNLLYYRDRWEMDTCEFREVTWMMKPRIINNYEGYLKNIETMLSVEKSGNKVFDKTKFWTVGKVSKEIAEMLETKTQEITISEFIYAKNKGWISDLGGHNEVEESDYYLLPYFLEHATEVYENTQKGELYLVSHPPKDEQTVIFIIDTKKEQNELVSYFFLTHYENYLASLSKKGSLEGPTAPSCITSQLREEAKRLVVGFSSRQTPLYRDFSKFFEGLQEQKGAGKIFLARHGESEGNLEGKVCGSSAPDFSLTQKGIEDAKKLAEECKNKGITKIITSPMKRTQQTAEIVAEELGLEVEIWDDIEEINMGEWDNTSFEKVAPTIPERIRKIYESEQGENSQKLLKRAEKFIDRLQKTERNGNILVVNHLVFSLATLTVLEDGLDSEKLYARREKGALQNGELKELPINLVFNTQHSTLTQDPDTLDTWFSSALWPFSTLGWPDKTPDFNDFFPTSVLETGHDILFFWVARMIMFSRFATGKNPFSDVYLHGLVCDEQGQKMSKSKGNGIDPLDMIERFGTDSVRMALVVGTTPGNQVNLGEKKIEGYRNFGNKLWNISRYILEYIKNDEENFQKHFTAPKTLPEKWILSKLQTLIAEVSEGIENHKYGEVGQKLYDFTWNDLADWAIESAKAVESETIGETLFHVLRELLKLLHPYMPFVTETILEELGAIKNQELKGNNCLALVNFPEVNEDLINKKAEDQFEILQNVIGKMRSLRSASKVDPVKKITAFLQGENLDFLKENKDIIALLARLETLQFGKKPNEECVSDIIDGVEIFLPLAGMLDMEKEAVRKAKKLEEARAQLKNLEGRLANKSYVENAPAHLVQQTKDQYQEVKDQIRILEEE